MDLRTALPAPHTIADRLRLILVGLRSVMGMWGLDGAVTVALSTRIGRAFGRIERMLRRFRAGTLRVGKPRPSPLHRHVTQAVRGPALPRTFGWLVGPGGHQAMGYRCQLVHLLTTEPEMMEMLRAHPPVRQVLRPLLRALGVDEFPWVPSPPRARKPRKPRPKPEPFRIKLPRGVISWARRGKRLDRAREELKRFRAQA